MLEAYYLPALFSKRRDISQQLGKSASRGASSKEQIKPRYIFKDEIANNKMEKSREASTEDAQNNVKDNR